MRGWLGAAVLCACLAACGPPPTREQRTVFAEPRVHPPLGTSAGQTVEKARLPSPPQDPRSRRVRERWVAPLRNRDLQPLTQTFSEDCVLTLKPDQPRPDGDVTREGRDALRGWLRGHVLAYPYAAVRVVYAGPSAREGVDVAELELLDACDAVLLRLAAKLHVQAERFTAVELRAHEPPPSACPR